MFFNFDVKKKKKAKATTQKRLMTPRWREPPSWDKARNQRREDRKNDQEENKKDIRLTNHTLANRRHHFYSQGKGQEGIALALPRTYRNIKRAIDECIEEMDLQPGQRKVWSDFVITVAGALDQYADTVMKLAYEIASRREPEQEEDQDQEEEGEGEDGKKRRKKRRRSPGVKCHVSDLEQAIATLYDLTH